MSEGGVILDDGQLDENQEVAKGEMIVEGEGDEQQEMDEEVDLNIQGGEQ